MAHNHLEATTTERTSPQRRGRRGRDRLAGPLFALPHGLGLAFFVLVPIAMALTMGFFNWPMIGARSFAGLANFTTLLGDPIFRDAVKNTTIFVITYVPANLVVSLGLAAWMGPNTPHRQFFRVLFFIPTITPIVANTVVWRMLYTPSGLIDAAMQSIFGVKAPNFLSDPNWAMAAIVIMSVWQGFGYNMLIFSAALDAVPDNLTEAAAIDGAGPVRTFFRVRLPLITPSIFYATTMTLITSFQIFAQPYILTKGGPGSSTMTVVLYLYNKGFLFQNLGLAAAAGSILFIVILIVTSVQFAGEKKWVHYD